MQVIIPTSGEYNKNIRRFVQFGGKHAQAAKKAKEIELWLTAGKDLTSQTTDHGENRIRNCVKYDLGNGFRLVTVHYGDIAVLLFIGDHAEADRWLTKNAGLTAVVSEADWRVEFTIPQIQPPWRVKQTEAVTPSNDPFLKRVSGVEWESIIASRAARSFLVKFDEDGNDQELLEILEELRQSQPREAQLCLTVINHLKAGEEEAAQAAVDVYLGNAKPASKAVPLTKEIFEAEPNQGRFIILNDLGEAELERYHDPLRFREWMTCLHSGQRRVVDEDFPGPALLTGVSGSGKTCVLAHRARRLAQFFNHDRILILTLNRALARLIEVLVGDLCQNGEKERIVVKPFHEFLSEVLSSLDCGSFLRRFGEFTGTTEQVEQFLSATPNTNHSSIFKPLTESEQLRAFEDFLSEPGNSAKAEFDRLEVYVFSQDQGINLRRYLFEELELVRSAFTCYDGYKGYFESAGEDSSAFKYQRTGRSIVFAEKRRNAIVSILREWEKFQLRRGFLDLMGLVQAAVFAVDERGEVPEQFRYRAVLVDEFQDFSTLELSLLGRLPKFAENGLFLTGDFAQKIYAKDLDLPKAKLGRDERTDRVIRRNYRNTREILLAAHALLQAYPPQLTSSDEEVKVLNPEYARRQAAKPIATQATDPVRAAWQYAVEWLDGGHVPFSVCIATANPSQLPVELLLQRKPAKVEAEVLTGDYLLKPGSVVVADITAVKGFEFSLIIICGLEKKTFPPDGVPSAEHWREAMRLYVAITRGRDEVRFLFQGEPSPFVTAMAEQVQFQTWEAPPEPEPEPPPPTAVGTEFKSIGEQAEAISQGVEPPEEQAPVAPHQTAPRPKETEAVPPEPESPPQIPEPLAKEPATAVEQTQPLPTTLAPVTPVTASAATQPVPAPAVKPVAVPKIGPSDRAATAEGSLVRFYERYRPELLNGVLVVPIPRGATQWELATALGLSQTAVSIACQGLGHFTAPNRPLPDHIIIGVCDYFRCVPNIIREGSQ